MDKRGVTAAQRRAVTACALLPAAVNILQPPVAAAGRGAWLCPLLALPVGLLVCWALGQQGNLLEKGLSLWGKFLALVYLAWGVLLLWGSAARFASRLERSVGSGAHPWAVLAVALALTIYLTRRSEVLARTGRVFFPALLGLILVVGVLALPALRWENLFPVSRTDWAGMPLGTAWALSLMGYAVYGRLLPADGEEAQFWLWPAGGCFLLSAVLLVFVGAFAPALVLRMDEPFLYLLSGVGVEGVFQRGESMLYALAALGDLSLFALLAHGCARLWRSLWGRGGWAPAAVGFALAAFVPGLGAGFLTGPVGLAGGLILGVAVPLAAFLPKRIQKGKERNSTFSGDKIKGEEDVGAKAAGKKSFKENEKKG